MFNIVIGCFCILVAIFLLLNSEKEENVKFILFSIIAGVINLGMGFFVYFNKGAYIVTITQKDGTSIEVEAKDYDVEDTYIKIKQDNGYMYVYEIKDVKVEKGDK